MNKGPWELLIFHTVQELFHYDLPPPPETATRARTEPVSNDEVLRTTREQVEKNVWFWAAFHTDLFGREAPIQTKQTRRLVDQRWWLGKGHRKWVDSE